MRACATFEVMRAPNTDRLLLIGLAVFFSPDGIRPSGIARLLGWHRSTVIRALPHLPTVGVYLWEDDDGRLYLAYWRSACLPGRNLRQFVD